MMIMTELSEGQSKGGTSLVARKSDEVE